MWFEPAEIFYFIYEVAEAAAVFVAGLLRGPF
jgi:hypothetical protein